MCSADVRCAVAAACPAAAGCAAFLCVADGCVAHGCEASPRPARQTSNASSRSGSGSLHTGIPPARSAGLSFKLKPPSANSTLPSPPQVTNYHVIQDASDIQVTPLGRGSRHAGRGRLAAPRSVWLSRVWATVNPQRRHHRGVTPYNRLDHPPTHPTNPQTHKPYVHPPTHTPGRHQVTALGGDEYSARVIGVDRDKDIAVLQVSPWPGVLFQRDHVIPLLPKDTHILRLRGLCNHVVCAHDVM